MIALMFRLAVVWVLAGAIAVLSGCAVEVRMKRIDSVEEVTHMESGKGFLDRAMTWMFTDSTKNKGDE